MVLNGVFTIAYRNSPLIHYVHINTSNKLRLGTMRAIPVYFLFICVIYLVDITEDTERSSLLKISTRLLVSLQVFCVSFLHRISNLMQ